MSQNSPAPSGGKTAPFLLGLLVGIVATALVGGLIMLTTRSSGGSAAPASSSAAPASSSAAPSPSASGITAEAVQAGLESVGLTKCTNAPAPTEGKTFLATNVICSDPKVDTNKVSAAVVTKNFEGARADLCRDVSADTSIQKVVMVSDMSSIIVIGGKNVLEFPNPPTADDVAKAVGARTMTVLEFCTA